MRPYKSYCKTLLSLFAITAVFYGGCDSQKAADTMKKAEESAENAAGSIADGAGEMVKEGEKMAADLGDKAKAWLEPMKEKFGSLEELKKTPEELKTAVGNMIENIEQKAEGINLPEAMSKSLATVKEKLVSLRDYLEGEYDQAGIDKYVSEVTDSVKSFVGLSK